MHSNEAGLIRSKFLSIMNLLSHNTCQPMVIKLGLFFILDFEIKWRSLIITKILMLSEREGGQRR